MNFGSLVNFNNLRSCFHTFNPKALNSYHKFLLTLLRYKKPLLILFGSWLLVEIALLFTCSLIDLNQYKPQIEKFAHKHTGKICLLKGPLHISSFPRMKIEGYDVIIKNSLHEQKALAKIEQFQIRSNLLLLLIGIQSFKLDLTKLELLSYSIAKFSTRFKLKGKIAQFDNTRLDLNPTKKNKIKTQDVFKKEKAEVEFKVAEKGIMKIDHFKVDASNDLPKITLKHEGSHFPIRQLGEILGHKFKISGDTNLLLELHAEGKSREKILKSLAGEVKIDIVQGKLIGVNILASLVEAKSLLNSLASKLSHTLSKGFNAIVNRRDHHLNDSTAFEALHLHFHIQEGIAKMEQASVKHLHFLIKGKGRINLVNNTLDCQVETLFKEHGPLRINDKTIVPLIVQVTGQLKEPSIKPDWDSYFKYTHNR